VFLVLASAFALIWFSHGKKLFNHTNGLPFNQKEKEKIIVPIDSAKNNKVLDRAQVTGVQDIEGPYKKVIVSDGETTFSFECPDKWLVETRNSGEIKMNEEELREFLATNYDGDIRTTKFLDKSSGKYYGIGSDYSDLSWNMLKDMPYDEMKKYYDSRRDKYSPGYPNATVSSDGKIWYTDIGWDQVHFYIMDKKKDSAYLSGVKYSNDLADDYEKANENTKSRLLRDEEGKPVVSKGQTYGLNFYISNKEKVIRIWKEAYVEGDFEEGFKHIMHTFQIQ
jgi:hypothetical protein